MMLMSFFTPKQLARTSGYPVIRRDPCRYCGCRNYQVEPGKAMHCGQLRCVQCRRFGKWLSKREWKWINGG